VEQVTIMKSHIYCL